MSVLCGTAYIYDEAVTCALVAGHEELITKAGTGDLTDDLWEIWDEPREEPKS